MDRLSLALTLVGGYALLAAAILVGVDVLLRRLAGTSVTGADELSGYALAIATSWALSYAFARKSHIRIDALYRLLPLRTKAVLDVLAAATMLLVAGLLIWQGAGEFLDSFAYRAVANTPFRTPLWIPQSLWLSGLCLFGAAVAATLCEAAIKLVEGDAAGVNAIGGMSKEAAD